MAGGEDEEVAALDRVLTRTVLTKDEDLDKLLVKLLPALVGKLATPQPSVRNKVLELLNHINKRIKALPSARLPLLPLLALALAPDAGPMVRSFGLVYVEMAQPRAEVADQLAAVPRLLDGLASRSPQHRAVALRVATGALSQLQAAPGGNYSQVVAAGGGGPPVAAASLLPPRPEDRRLFLQHVLRVMLYQRPSSGVRGPATPLAVANAAAAAGASPAAAAAAAATPATPPPAGLSLADVALLEEKGVPPQELLTQMKLGLLSLLAGAAAGMPGNAAAAAAAAPDASASGLPPPPAATAAAMDVDWPAAPAYLGSEELLLPLLAASCDPYEQVSRRGADLLTKVVNPDAAKPAVDLESPEVVGALMRLMLGNQDPSVPAPAPTPAGPALSLRIMQLLVRSVAAAGTFPAAPLVMSACMFGPSSSPRLVRLGAEWAGWVFKHAPQHQLKAMAGPVLARLLAALGLEDGKGETEAGAGSAEQMQVDGAQGGTAAGALPPSLAANAEARGHMFSALAQLAKRLPEVFQADTALAGRLFAVLAAEPPGSRASLQEALGGLAAAMQVGLEAERAGGSAVDAAQVEELEQLLLQSITSDQPAVRLCAAQWASRLFPRNHVPSRYVCLLAAGDAKAEVREVGLAGLGLSATQLPHGALPSAYRAAVAALGLPPPGAVVQHLVSKHPALAQPADLGRPLPLPDASCQALAAFIRAAATAAAAHLTGAAAQTYEPLGHAALLENLACRGSGRETAAAALEGLVELASGHADIMRGRAADAEALQTRLAGRQAWTAHWLSHTHLPVRLAAARLTALAAAAAQPEALGALAQQLRDSFPPLAPGAGGSSASSRLEEQEGALLAAGLLVARSATCAQPLLTAELQQQLVAELTQQLQHHASAISEVARGRPSSEGGAEGPSGGSGARTVSLTLAGAAAQALGFIGLTGSVELPGLLGGKAGATAAGGGAGPPADGTGPQAAAAAAAAAGPGGLLGLLLGLGACKDNRVVQRAVTAVGHVAAGSGDAELHLAAAKGLLQLAKNKGASEEVLLAAGEALAAAAGDVTGLDSGLLLWSNVGSAAEAVDWAAPAGAEGAERMEVDRGPGAGGGAARRGVQEFVLDELMSRMAVPTAKEEVRCAGCLLLVSLLQLCRGSELLASRLPQLQATFTGLLGDGNDLTQDLAARGVSLVYGRGGGALKDQLLGQLVGLLQGGAGAAVSAGVKLVASDTKLEEGSMAGGSGGLATYRELCSLANDLGQPELIYRFMDLARASSTLSAKRGAAVGVAHIARLAAGGSDGAQAGGALAALLGPERMTALLPKLFRLTHDPSPKVADSMGAIWAALVDDPRATLDQNFDALAKALLADVGARMWRVRQASCSALTDLLSGRRWAQLQPHMEQLWVMALRGADDVKESVRDAAAGLLRSLRGISLRLMDLQQTPAADVAGCCAVVLPLLCGTQGLGSSVPEVCGVAADVVATALKTAGPAQVAPVLPAVVPVLLEALSGMEDARLNYVEQHAERIGVDAEQLAAARLAASRSSSISEALDAAARAITPAGTAELAPALSGLVRKGVGLATKAGTARFVRALAVRLGAELRPTAPALLKPLAAAVASERSGQVKRAYASAAAALAVRCAGDKRRDRFVTDAVASYGAAAAPLERFEPGAAPGGGAGVAPSAMAVDEPSSSQDEGSRLAGGLLLRELLRESGDVFGLYASQVLPVAFVASRDEVPAVAAAWGGVWSEGCPSEPATLRMHAAELAELVAGGLASSNWGKKKGAAEALMVLADVAPEQLAPFSPALARLLLADVLAGRLWEGKEHLLVALGSLGAACTAVLVQQPGAPALLIGLLAAAARKKTAFRAAALAALQQVLAALAKAGATEGGVDGGGVWDTVSPPLLEALQQQLSAKQRAAPAASGAGGTTVTAAEQADEPKPLPLAETCGCLEAAWKLLPTVRQAAAAQQLVEPLAGLLTAHSVPWASWLAVVGVVQALVVPGAGPADGSRSTAAACMPLAGGLVHVLQHSTIAQLRLKCLEVLDQLLVAVEADTAAASGFREAGAGGREAGGPGGTRLAQEVAACLSQVAAQDPSAAHKAIAAKAAAAVERIAGALP